MFWKKDDTDVETNSPGQNPNQNIDSLESVKANLKKTKKNSRQAFEDRIKEEKLQADLDALYAAENWEAIASLYFDIRYVSTGFEGFPLNEDQKKKLSTSLATLMRSLPVEMAPYYIAGVVFMVNFSGVIISKEYSYSKVKAQAKEAKKE